MIKYSEIEAAMGIKTLMTDQMQDAIEEWYRAAIDGESLDHNPDTMPGGWPAAICAEEARLTTLELEAHIEGSPRADWINDIMQRQVLAPRRRRILSVALALGSGIWKPYQSGSRIGVTFVPATGYYPVANNTEGELTEAVFVDQITDSDNYYNRLEWMHVLEGPEDYHDSERDLLEELDLDAAASYPCVQVISLAYLSSTKDGLGSRVELGVRPEWADIEPVAYLTGLSKLPVGQFVTPIVNTVDPTSDLGAAMFAPAIPQIIDADVQYTRLDWEYEGGELAVDTDVNYLKPSAGGQTLTDDESLRRFGVPAKALKSEEPHHRDRLFHGIDVNTGITQSAPFYQVFSPALRDNSYLGGLNQYIRNIESHAGLSYGVFSQMAEVEKTATEIVNSRQKLYTTISDLQAALESTLKDLVDALNFWADQTKDAPARGAVNTSFHWDDSIIIDRLTEMAQWQQELALGIRSKLEYRMHFFGEDEATAQKQLASVRQENAAAMAATDVLKGVLGNGKTDGEGE